MKLFKTTGILILGTAAGYGLFQAGKTMYQKLFNSELENGVPTEEKPSTPSTPTQPTPKKQTSKPSPQVEPTDRQNALDELAEMKQKEEDELRDIDDRERY